MIFPFLLRSRIKNWESIHCERPACPFGYENGTGAGKTLVRANEIRTLCGEALELRIKIGGLVELAHETDLRRMYEAS